MSAAVSTMVVCVWLLREVSRAERPIASVGAAVGAVVAIAGLLVAVRWIERDPATPEGAQNDVDSGS